MNIKTFLKHYAALIVAGLVAVVAVVGMMNASSHREAVLDAQGAKINQLKGDVAIKDAAVQKAKDAAAQAATGIEAKRKQDDDAKVTELMRTAMTWDSYDSYMDARSAVMQNFAIAEDSDFMTKTLPKVENRTDPSGRKINMIDTKGWNISFGELTSRVTSIRTTDYNYFAVIRSSSTSADGKASADSYYSASYTIDANGTIKNIVMDTISQKPSTTGS